MNYPLISILMTAYNREKYIAEAIESVLASTYSAFELLIVDDHSIDSTLAIAKKYESIDKRVTVFSNDRNLGQFGNRNKAASYAKGVYLKYVDSDDIIYPYTLQSMLEAMQEFPEAGLGFCLTHGECKKPLPYKIDAEEAIQQHYLEGGLLFVGPTGLIIRKDVFDVVAGFEEYGMPSDNHLTLKIASKYPIIALPRDLFWWRMHDEQVFVNNLNNHDNILNNYRYSSDIIIHYSPLSKNINKTIIYNLKKIFFLGLIRLAFRNLKPRLASDLLIQYMRRSK